MFISGPQYPPPIEDPFMEARLAELAKSAAATAASGDAAHAGAPAGASWPVPIVAMAPTHPAVRELVLDLAGSSPLYLGETVTATMEVCGNAWCHRPGTMYVSMCKAGNGSLSQTY